MMTRDSFADEPVTAGTRPCVLVVHEDDVRRRNVANALRKDGYDLLEKRTLEDALALFGDKVRAPDAVVCTRVDLLAHLRARGWSTPIVVIAADSSVDLEAARDAASAYGPDAVVSDSIDALRRVMLDVLWPRTTLASI